MRVAIRKISILLVILILVLIYWNGLEKVRSENSKCSDEDQVSWPLLNTQLRLLIDSPCKNASILILVTSHADHVSLRGQLRHLVPSAELEKLSMRRVFMLGHPKSRGPPFKSYGLTPICQEQKIHGDLVVGDFEESYRNLTLKHMMGLRWAMDCCAEVKLILKQDDDILVDYYQLWTILNSPSSSQVHRGEVARGQVSSPALDQFRRDVWALPRNFILGKPLVNMRAIRDKSSKWFVSGQEYPQDFYPNFVSGWAYITNMETLRALMSHSRREYFWIDDVYVTGTLRERAGVGTVDLSPVFTHYKGHLLCCFAGRSSYKRGPSGDKMSPSSGKRDPAGNKKGPYWCDFLVGPSMDDDNLRKTFYNHAEFCHKSRTCTWRPAGFDLNRTCVVTPDLIVRDPEDSLRNKGPKSVLKRITL